MGEGRTVACSRSQQMQPREFQLLEYLLRNAERVVTRTMLLESVWDFHFDPKTNIVETHMSRLRVKAQPIGAGAELDSHRARRRLCPARPGRERRRAGMLQVSVQSA